MLVAELWGQKDQGAFLKQCLSFLVVWEQKGQF